MRQRNWLVLSAVVFFLSACSQQTHSLYETSKLAIFGQKDVEMTVEKVQSIPYASAYLKVGDGPQAFIVLGAANNQGLRWYTADKSVIVTRNGRVVKTVGLPEDLLFSSDANTDPLQQPKSLLNASSPISWTHHEYLNAVNLRSGFTYHSVFQNLGPQSIVILDQTHASVLIEEQVEVPALNKNYRNYFWLDAKTGRVLKSEQQLTPFGTIMHFTVLKPYEGRS